MREITETQALNRLRAKINYHTSQSDLAYEFGVSPSFMSDVLRGIKGMNADMLKSIGVERRVVYLDSPNEPEE